MKIFFLLPFLFLPNAFSYELYKKWEMPWQRKVLSLEEEQLDLENRVLALEALDKSIRWNQEQILRLQKQSPNKEKERSLTLYENKLQEIEEAFFSTASGISSGEFKASASEKIQKRNLVEEAQTLIAPLLDAIGRLSEKPRKIESMRKQVEIFSDEIKRIDQGILLIQKILSLARPGTLGISRVQQVQENLLHRKKEYTLFQEALQRQLDTELLNERPLMEQIREMGILFLKTKGINLLLALFSFCLVFWMFWVLGHRKKVHVRAAWHFRPLKVLFYSIAIFCSTLTLLLVLYLRHDWFLFTLILFFLFSLGWSFKHYAPRFLTHAKLMLNLGSVKEGELLIWNGIPWMVETLHFSCILSNPFLQGGRVRVQAKDLIDGVSRPCAPQERLFPSQVGDYVLLNVLHPFKEGNVVFGKVLSQTPLQVEVQVLSPGNMGTVHIPTAQYFGMHLSNLSQGLSLEIKLEKEKVKNPLPLKELQGKFPLLENVLVLDTKKEWYLQLQFSGHIAPQWPILEDLVRDICSVE